MTVADWFDTDGADGDARLVLFPYAGAGAWAYHEWSKLLPDVATTRATLPGREQRHAEPPRTELGPLVNALCEALTAELDGRPYALFGHSMGALLAYRVAVALERAGEVTPALVAVSGWAPEGFRMPVRRHDNLSDIALAERIRTLGVLPADVVDDPALLELVMPVLRADLSVCATYRDDQARLAAAVVGYCGAADPLMTPDAMASWAGRTRHYLGHRTFPGGHFFLHQHAPAITGELATLLRRHAR